MNKEQKQQIMAGVLGLVLVGVMIKMFVLDGGSTPPSSATGAGAAASSTINVPDLALKEVDVDLTALLADIKQVSFPYKDEHIERDPMTPLVRAKLTGPKEEQNLLLLDDLSSLHAFVLKMRVTGIVWNQYNPVAVVDDELVRVGHTYANGVQVIAIDRNQVWFDIKDNEIPLKLKEL